MIYCHVIEKDNVYHIVITSKYSGKLNRDNVIMSTDDVSHASSMSMLFNDAFDAGRDYERSNQWLARC